MDKAKASKMFAPAVKAMAAVVKDMDADTRLPVAARQAMVALVIDTAVASWAFSDTDQQSVDTLLELPTILLTATSVRVTQRGQTLELPIRETVAVLNLLGLVSSSFYAAPVSSNRTVTARMDKVANTIVAAISSTLCACVCG